MLIYVFPFLFSISSYNMFHLYLFKLIVNFYMVADILTAAQEVYQMNYVSVHQPLLSLLSSILVGGTLNYAFPYYMNMYNWNSSD